MLLFYTPWKHLKTFRFSDVFRGYGKVTPGCNGIIYLWLMFSFYSPRKHLKTCSHFILAENKGECENATLQKTGTFLFKDIFSAGEKFWIKKLSYIINNGDRCCYYWKQNTKFLSFQVSVIYSVAYFWEKILILARTFYVTIKV